MQQSASPEVDLKTVIGYPEEDGAFLYALSPNGTVVQIAGDSVGVLGYTPEEMIGRPFTDFLVESERARQQERFDALMRGEEVDTTVFRGWHKDGRTVTFEIWPCPLRRNGSIVGAWGRIRRFKERRRMNYTLIQVGGVTIPDLEGSGAVFRVIRERLFGRADGAAVGKFTVEYTCAVDPFGNLDTLTANLVDEEVLPNGIGHWWGRMKTVLA